MILAHPKRVLPPRVPARRSSPGSASSRVIGIFLAAFAIPVTFESVMWVTGSGSLANVVSVTPGAVGITQATNALALDTCCDVAEGRRGRLLHRAAADHDRLERPLRARARRLGLRLDGRQEARRRVVHRREGQGRPSRRPSAPRRRRRRRRSASRRRPRATRQRAAMSRLRRRDEEDAVRAADAIRLGARAPAHPPVPPARRVGAVRGVALLVAAWVMPGVHINGFWGALLVAAAHRAPERDPAAVPGRAPAALHARARLPARARRRRARCSCSSRRSCPDALTVDSFGGRSLGARSSPSIASASCSTRSSGRTTTRRTCSG